MGPTCAYVSHGMQHSPLSFDLYSTSRTGNQHVVLFHVSLWTSCKQREQRHGTDLSTRTVFGSACVVRQSGAKETESVRL